MLSVTIKPQNGVNKYKPRTVPHLLENRAVNSKEHIDSAISSAKKTVQRVKVTVNKTRELIEQSKQLINASRKRR